MPGESTYTRHRDELKLQGVAGGREAAEVLLKDGHSQHHRDGDGVVESSAGVAAVAAGLVDDLRYTVQVDVLPVKTNKKRH